MVVLKADVELAGRVLDIRPKAEPDVTLLREGDLQRRREDREAFLKRKRPDRRFCREILDCENERYQLAESLYHE
jgi:hypothetical protein